MTHGPADACTTAVTATGLARAARIARPMTFPLMALAVGAIVAGFVGIPHAIGGTNEIEHFLEPSFTAHASCRGAWRGGGTLRRSPRQPPRLKAEHAAEGGEHRVSQRVELGLMAFSVLIAVIGIWTAYRFYVRGAGDCGSAEGSVGRARTRCSPTSTTWTSCTTRTFVKGTMASAFGLWAFDRRVVDGAVNGSGWLTVFASWISSLIDKYIVDGAVNLVGRSAEESSFVFRRVQTGLIQNYALLMLFGVFAFVSIYLLVR